MNILMLTTPTDTSLKNVIVEKKIHLGVAYIVSMLEKEGHDVTFLDLYIGDRRLPDIMNFFDRPDWVSLLPNAYIGLPPFAPFLYAASIFVLFTHFSKMVTFESEVA